jgi:hypothetical protein
MEIKEVKENKDNMDMNPNIMDEDQLIPLTVIIKDFNSNYIRTDVQF